MSDRYEVTLDPYLIGILAQQLCRVLKQEGYEDVLRIPEPEITEFRKGASVVSLQLSHPHGHRQSLAMESESTDVDPMVAAAVKDAIVAVSDQLLNSLPWLDRKAVTAQIETHLSRLVMP